MSAPRRRPFFRCLAVPVALGVSALLLTACADAGTTRASARGAAAPGGSAAPASPSAPMDEETAVRRALVPAATVTWDEAADTAVRQVADSKLVDIELTRTSRGAAASTGSPDQGTPGPAPAGGAPAGGAPAWEADVATPDGTLHRVDIDAVSGEVVRTRVVADQDAADKREMADRLDTTAQSPQQAVAVATGRTRGTVTGVDLDDGDDDREARWTVDVVPSGTGNETTFDIDATDGTILAESTDDD